MPKISSNSETIHHDDIKKNFTIVVMYNQEFRFYSVIPTEFMDVVHHLSDDDCKVLNIRKKNKVKYDRSKGYDALVTADSEAECLSKTKLAYKQFMSKTIEKRNVIIVFYNGKHNTSYGGFESNKEHPFIKIEFALTYAVETTAGDKKVYNIYKTHPGFGNDIRTTRSELNLWNKEFTIIPDTPENRSTLENLYSALNTLNSKLSLFTENSEQMLEFISGGIKLLN